MAPMPARRYPEFVAPRRRIPELRDLRAEEFLNLSCERRELVLDEAGRRVAARSTAAGISRKASLPVATTAAHSDELPKPGDPHFDIHGK